ncbi:hypothetical protein B0H17DRAFT_1146334 [Mycena rosella]|uniref:Uncharacterized protein n=1 Tax=Mycena rosella TaxID=1033263 RepID=A0AAD7CP45_MYCRO|nr:hypothetical protein B0H17DRAFT_1146334 [Mycena rosella]
MFMSIETHLAGRYKWLVTKPRSSEAWKLEGREGRGVDATGRQRVVVLIQAGVTLRLEVRKILQRSGGAGLADLEAASRDRGGVSWQEEKSDGHVTPPSQDIALPSQALAVRLLNFYFKLRTTAGAIVCANVSAPTPTSHEFNVQPGLTPYQELSTSHSSNEAHSGLIIEYCNLPLVLVAKFDQNVCHSSTRDSAILLWIPLLQSLCLSHYSVPSIIVLLLERNSYSSECRACKIPKMGPKGLFNFRCPELDQEIIFLCEFHSRISNFRGVKGFIRDAEGLKLKEILNLASEQSHWQFIS